MPIRTASGEAYPVTHPESIWQEPGGTTVIIAVAGQGVVMIDATLISEVQFATGKPRRSKGPEAAE